MECNRLREHPVSFMCFALITFWLFFSAFFVKIDIFADILKSLKSVPSDRNSKFWYHVFWSVCPLFDNCFRGNQILFVIYAFCRDFRKVKLIVGIFLYIVFDSWELLYILNRLDLIVGRISIIENFLYLLKELSVKSQRLGTVEIGCEWKSRKVKLRKFVREGELMPGFLAWILRLQM